MTDPRPFADLRTTGLLWLINTTVFHPRGFALAMHLDEQGTATGWSLMGDGNEPWTFQLPDAEADRLFNAVKDLFEQQAADAPPDQRSGRTVTVDAGSASDPERAQAQAR